MQQNITSVTFSFDSSRTSSTISSALNNDNERKKQCIKCHTTCFFLHKYSHKSLNTGIIKNNFKTKHKVKTALERRIQITLECSQILENSTKAYIIKININMYINSQHNEKVSNQ